jgi:hypothetical protein
MFPRRRGRETDRVTCPNPGSGDGSEGLTAPKGYPVPYAGT